METSAIGRPNVTPDSVALTDSVAPRRGAPENKALETMRSTCHIRKQTA